MELTLYAPNRPWLKEGLSARVLLLLPRGREGAEGGGPDGVTEGNVKADPIDAVELGTLVTEGVRTRARPMEAPKN